MLKVLFQSKLILFIFIYFLSKNVANSQTKTDVSLYNWFDETVGRENLSVNNGILYIDHYNCKNSESCFLKSKSFVKGAVRYDGQPFFELNINYDIYKDNLILETISGKTKTLITLISDKIEAFVFEDTEFCNLKIHNVNSPDFIKGFYETSFSTKEFELFIKHSKDKRDVIKDDNIVYTEFEKKSNFILKKQNSFYQIDSKSDVVKLFPNFKKNINEYYDLNYKSEKSNKILFTVSLMKFISNLK